MLKKSMAIVLSMALLLTILPLSAVYASYPTAALQLAGAKADAVEVADGIATDNFEFDYKDNVAKYLDADGTGIDQYPKTNNDYLDNNGNQMTSDVFVGISCGKNPFTFAKDSTGNQVLQVTNVVSGTNAAIYNRTRYFDFKPGQNIRLSYDVCFPTIPTDMTSTNFLRFMNNGYGGIIMTTVNGQLCLYPRETSSSAADANSFKPVAGKWYTIVGVVDDNGYLTTYFMDKETQEIKIKCRSGSARYTDSKSGCDPWLLGADFPETGTVAADAGKLKVWLDNAELVFYTPSAYAPSVTGFSINNNAVVSTAGSISVTLDQPIATPAAKFTDALGNEISVTATPSKNKFNTYDIPLAALEAGTTYTLDVSGFKNSGALGATTNATVVFSTEEGDIVTFADAFENSTLITTRKNSYNINAATNDSSPLKTNLTYGEQNGSVYLSDSGTGYGNSGSALTIYTAGAEDNNLDKKYGPSLCTSIAYTPATHTEGDGITENERIVITYRLKIEEGALVNNPTEYVNSSGSLGTLNGYGSQLRIGANTSASGPSSDNSIARINHAYTTVDGNRVYEDKMYVSNSTSNYSGAIDEKKWYNVTWTIDGDNQKIKFVDSTNGKLIWEGEKTIEFNSSSLYFFPVANLARYYGTGSAYNVGQTVLIDDFTLYRIKPWVAKHALTATQSVSGVDTVLTFNQPTAAGAKAFELYKGEYTAGAANNTRVYQAPDVTYPDFCQQKISFDNLDYLTDYAVDYSAITSEGGAALSASDKASAVAEFTTPAHPEAAFISSDIECSSLSAGGTITFDVYSKQSETVDIIASLHKRNYPAKLETVEKLEDVSLSAGEKTPVSITLSKNVDADYIRIFAWDGTTLTPLMSDYEALAPVDTLNVLMIGSSLSEDTGRYFDNMLQAAGYNSDTVKNIDITVKGVGGGHFTYHAANLKRELAEGLDKKYAQTEDNGAVHTYIQEQTAIMNGEAVDPGDGPDEKRRLYFTYENGVKVNAREDNLLVTALMEKQYDIITLQPGANYYSYAYDDYEDALSYLTTKLREIQPNAEIMLFQTWSPWYESQASRLNYFSDKIKPYMEKWAKNTADVTENVTLNGEPMKVIPSGYAFFLADTFTQWGGDKYNLDSGNSTAEAKGNELIYSNAANGLMRDYNHASFYGQYLSDAVWYETFTGKKAPVTYSNGAPVIAKPTGKGPALDENGKMVSTEATETYFTAISDAEHIARLQMLSDIAHQVVEEYKGEFER